MKIFYYTALSFLIIFSFSFKVDNAEFLGLWAVSLKPGFFFEKVAVPPKNRSYFILKKKGVLEYKQNNRTCGDIESGVTTGTWKQIDDSTLALTYHSCAGEVYVQWDRDTKSKEKLRYRRGAFTGNASE